MSITIVTADGTEVTEGARVFDFYDGHWGTVGTIDSEGWFDHYREDGGRGYLNGERVCVRIPSGNPFYASHGETTPAPAPVTFKKATKSPRPYDWRDVATYAVYRDGWHVGYVIKRMTSAKSEFFWTAYSASGRPLLTSTTRTAAARAFDTAEASK